MCNSEDVVIRLFALALYWYTRWYIIERVVIFSDMR